MNKQDKKMVNAWIEFIRASKLKDIPEILKGFHSAINSKEILSQDELRFEGRICVSCGNVRTAASGEEKSKYFWVKDTDHNKCRLFKRDYIPGGLKDRLVEILELNPTKDVWYCAKGTSTQKSEDPIRLIAMVNILKGQAWEYDYTNFCDKDVSCIVKEQESIIDIVKELR